MSPINPSTGLHRPGRYNNPSDQTWPPRPQLHSTYATIPSYLRDGMSQTGEFTHHDYMTSPVALNFRSDELENGLNLQNEEETALNVQARRTSAGLESALQEIWSNVSPSQKIRQCSTARVYNPPSPNVGWSRTPSLTLSPSVESTHSSFQSSPSQRRPTIPAHISDALLAQLQNHQVDAPVAHQHGIIRLSVLEGTRNRAQTAPGSILGRFHGPNVHSGEVLTQLPEAQLPEAQLPEALVNAVLGSRGAQGFQPSILLGNILGTSTVQANGSSTYGGQGTRGSNQDHTLSEALNCGVWILGIHPQARQAELLDAIRKCGRVFSCWVNPPTAGHSNCASKTVFTTRQGAENFMRKINSPEGIRVLGQRISATFNRLKYRANRDQAQSRVIRIYGPAKFVDPEFLNCYFSKLFYYHTCRVILGQLDMNNCRHVDWYFGSILAQSSSAKMAIENEPRLKYVLTVEYLPDPCE